MRSASAQAKLRREVFHANKQLGDDGRPYLICAACGGKIDVATEGWEAAHDVADYFGGTTAKPMHVKCHRRLTATEDIPAIAKSKRLEEKHLGIRRKGWGRR